MASQAQQFLDRIANATGTHDLDEVCALAGGIHGDALHSEAFGRHLGRALHTCLSRASDHPSFRQWLDCYFGLTRTQFRSPLQQPNYLYYPSLPPKAWFSTEEVPELGALRGHLDAVQQEVRAYLESASDFSPYVSPQAGREAKWRELAGRDTWSAIHLVRRGAWDEQVLSRLPETRRFLESAPLAYCPPHAPECFLSRLLPGAVLPPHYGLSNIKLTAHLPVVLPSRGCSITVADVTRTWSEDDFLIFDDSFLHSASNHAETSRTVLILDVWHPLLSSSERSGLSQAILMLDRVNAAIADAKANTGQAQGRNPA